MKSTQFLSRPLGFSNFWKLGFLLFTFRTKREEKLKRETEIRKRKNSFLLTFYSLLVQPLNVTPMIFHALEMIQNCFRLLSTVFAGVEQVSESKPKTGRNNFIWTQSPQSIYIQPLVSSAKIQLFLSIGETFAYKQFTRSVLIN